MYRVAAQPALVRFLSVYNRLATTAGFNPKLNKTYRMNSFAV